MPYLAWAVALLLLLFVLLIVWSHSAAAQTARGREAVLTAMRATPDPARGAALFARHCAKCHGPLAFGDPLDVVPVLAGQHERYLIKQLIDAAEGDRTISEMHRVVARTEVVEPQSVRDIASFVSALKAPTGNERGDGHRLDVGGKLYRAHCAGCHGAQAQGDPVQFVPQLRHQHFSYLVAQMRRLAVGHRYSVGDDVVKTLDALSLPDLMAVADFASRQPGMVGVRVPQQPNGLSTQHK